MDELGIKKYIFCNLDESIEYLFIHCSVASCIWHWIANYNNFNFSTHHTSLIEL
jgi:hypothetical protein